jgi:hypothetical protein
MHDQPEEPNIMNLLALFAILLTLAGWVLTALTGMNLLSGHFDGRTCLTDCVQMLFFSAVATGVAGLVLSGLSLLSTKGRVLSWVGLLMALALCSIFAVLFITGNFV